MNSNLTCIALFAGLVLSGSAALAVGDPQTAVGLPSMAQPNTLSGQDALSSGVPQKKVETEVRSANTEEKKSAPLIPLGGAGAIQDKGAGGSATPVIPSTMTPLPSTGRLMVEKEVINLSGLPVPSVFSMTVNCRSASGPVIGQLQVTRGSSLPFASPIASGSSCTVIEARLEPILNVKTCNGGSASWTTSYQPAQTATIVANATTTIKVLNTINCDAPPLSSTGRLIVEKVVVNTLGVSTPAIFNMTVNCRTLTGSLIGQLQVPAGAGAPFTSPIPASSNCSVIESRLDSIRNVKACNGGTASWVTSYSPAQTVMITANAVTTEVVTNTLKCDDAPAPSTGRLTVAKVVVNPLNIPAPSVFDVTVNCRTESVPVVSQLQIPAGSGVSLAAPVAAGSNCTVIESRLDSIRNVKACNGGTASWTTTYAPAQTVAIVANAVSTSTITNTLACDQQEIKYDVGIRKTGSDTLTVGQIGTFTLNPVNNGPASVNNASGMVVTDTLPGNFTMPITASGAPNWNCMVSAASPYKVTCNYIGTAPVGSGVPMSPITITAMAGKPGDGRNCTSIALKVGDSKPGDNSSCIPFVIRPAVEKLGKLTVVKVVDNTLGVPNPATFSMNANCGQSGGTYNLSVAAGAGGVSTAIAAGSTCSVNETQTLNSVPNVKRCHGSSASWTTSYAPSPASVLIASGQESIVTVTNSLICDKPPVPNTGGLTVEKVVVNSLGVQTPTSFTMSVACHTPTAPLNVQLQVPSGSGVSLAAPIAAGSPCKVTEQPLDSILNVRACNGGSASWITSYAPTQTVTIVAGVTTTSVVTNTLTCDKPGTLTVRKEIIGGTHSDRFNLLIDGNVAGTGANVGNGGTTGAMSVNPGSHTVSETAGNSSNLGNYVATYSSNCQGGHISVSPGASEICTITNQKKPLLVVNKILVPSNDSGKFNLLVDGDATGTGANVGNNGTTGIVFVSVGSHAVTETAIAGTNLNNYTTTYSSDCAGGNLAATWGDYKTCTITNTRKPTLVVNKVFVPANDPGKVVIKLDGAIIGAQVAHLGTTAAVATTVGTHVVTEFGTSGLGGITDIANYTSVMSGSGCNPDGTVTLVAGENKVCTLTNTRKPAHGTWSQGPGTYSFTVCAYGTPCNINDIPGRSISILMKVWGGGGGGGGGKSASSSGGSGAGGGGGAGYGNTTLIVGVPSSGTHTYYVRVGSGGVGGQIASNGVSGEFSEIRLNSSGGAIVLKGNGGSGGNAGNSLNGGSGGEGSTDYAGGSSIYGITYGSSGSSGDTGSDDCHGGDGGGGGFPGAQGAGHGGSGGHGGYMHHLVFPSCTEQSQNNGLTPGVAGENGKVTMSW